MNFDSTPVPTAGREPEPGGLAVRAGTGHIQFDRYQRLVGLSRIILQVVSPGDRVLDVGGHPCELSLFLPRQRVFVADLPPTGPGRYARADGAHLPFDDASFDAVVCSDVLEHIDPARRLAFINELFRVSRGWLMLGVPRGGADVRAAEVQVDEFHSALHGFAHPWLADHFSLGVPTRGEMVELLHAAGARFVRFSNGYLPRWVTAMVVNRYLECTERAEERLSRFNLIYNRVYADHDYCDPAYRDIYAATRGPEQMPTMTPGPPRSDWNPFWTAFLRSQEDADIDLPVHPEVTVVIITFNHQGSIVPCIDALKKSHDTSPEIIVVDNGSDDESASRAFDAGAVVLRNGRNRGFAAAFNVGWRAGRGQIVVAVNPDVVVEPDALGELVQACMEDRNTAVAGAMLLNWDGDAVLHAGGCILPNFCTRHLGRGQPVDAAASPREVDYVTGALMAVKRSVLERMGGLDERYWPAYYEETDFCVRVRARGFKVVYWPWARGRHRESSTLGAQSEQFFRAYHRGRLRFIASHLTLRDMCSFLRAEKAFRADRATGDVEMVGLRHVWRGWWWRLPSAWCTRRVGGMLTWRRS